mmetsp:Transcript_5686/g.14180  ORF Transcript_5686/g.14180 Transcript_5686/m.14180 type:complete len:201 (+) Transcript_5686:1053-1655(+)
MVIAAARWAALPPSSQRAWKRQRPMMCVALRTAHRLTQATPLQPRALRASIEPPRRLAAALAPAIPAVPAVPIARRTARLPLACPWCRTNSARAPSLIWTRQKAQRRRPPSWGSSALQAAVPRSRAGILGPGCVGSRNQALCRGRRRLRAGSLTPEAAVTNTQKHALSPPRAAADGQSERVRLRAACGVSALAAAAALAA